MLELTKQEKRVLKNGHAQILRCANCNQEVLYGAMPLISMAIRKSEPVCQDEKCLTLWRAKYNT